MLWISVVSFAALATVVHSIPLDLLDTGILDDDSDFDVEPVVNQDISASLQHQDALTPTESSNVDCGASAFIDDVSIDDVQKRGLFRRQKACRPTSFTKTPMTKNPVNLPNTAPSILMRPEEQKPYTRTSNNRCSTREKPYHVKCGGPEIAARTYTVHGVLNCVEGKFLRLVSFPITKLLSYWIT